MSLINIKNLTFSYPGSFDNIFNNVTLQLDTDWKLGFVGRNGKGKSTLFKLLLNKEEFSGTIDKTVEMLYFPYEVQNENITVAELIYSINPYAEWWKVIKDLNHLGLKDFEERVFATLSGGEKSKALLAILFGVDNSFLLIDEPTNHLDLEGRKQLSEFLNTKSGYILISHDKAFLDGCVDHILTIERQNIDIFKGNYSQYYNYKIVKDKSEISANARLKEDIRKLKESAERTAEWAGKTESDKYGKKNSGLRPDRGFIGAKSAKLMKRATTTKARAEKLITEKQGLLKNIDRTEQVKFKSIDASVEQLIYVKDFVAYYNNKAVNLPLSFEIKRGERVSVSGINGSGKSTLVKVLLGDSVQYTGEIYISNRIKISYVPQNTDFLYGDIEDYISENHLDKTLLFTILRKLGFERTQFLKTLENYSDGQKKKLLIAKSLCENASLYIWDEPLNYIDIITRTEIESLLLSSNVSMLFIEHDLSFKNRIATKEIQLDKFINK